jgi:hypothetical protein
LLCINREPLDIGGSDNSNSDRVAPDALAVRLIFLKRPQPTWDPLDDEATRQDVTQRLLPLVTAAMKKPNSDQ